MRWKSQGTKRGHQTRLHYFHGHNSWERGGRGGERENLNWTSFLRNSYTFVKILLVFNSFPILSSDIERAWHGESPTRKWGAEGRLLLCGSNWLSAMHDACEIDLEAWLVHTINCIDRRRNCMRDIEEDSTFFFLAEHRLSDIVAAFPSSLLQVLLEISNRFSYLR